jgi:hypothetical protein
MHHKKAQSGRSVNHYLKNIFHLNRKYSPVICGTRISAFLKRNACAAPYFCVWYRYAGGRVRMPGVVRLVKSGLSVYSWYLW